ncbi:MAG: NmrA family NAD(P)-binding protein [Streptomyces sp.]|nr:NmrA family NAD(P)-binding protein [Streptomyces sp.]NUS79360.1 NmrA family NAD(P)-binding protein [Streptomyces sp.]
MPETVLVTGATGTVGRRLVAALSGQGGQGGQGSKESHGGRRFTVRALVRDPGRAGPPEGADETVTGDLTDSAAMAEALHGVSTAFVVLAADAGDAFAQAAEKTETLRHLVVVSADAPPDSAHRGPLFARHVLGEARMTATGVPVTVLRPAPFATQALGWAADLAAGDTVHVVHPDLAVPVIDPRDVAEAAAAALRGAPPDGARVLRLSGPQILDVPERVRVLGEVLGRELSVARVEPDLWVDRVAPFLPEAYARGLLDVERYLHERRLPVVPTVRELTGRAPRSFRTWAEDHAAAFGAPGRGPSSKETS